MPIKIPTDLPAKKILNSENIFVMTETRAESQEIRPLQILLLNLMPTKVTTETQLCRLLGNTPLQIELELLQTKTHKATHTSEEHMLAFYKTFDEVRDRNFDGLIITGAPVEQMDFEEVDYWDELKEIMDGLDKGIEIEKTVRKLTGFGYDKIEMIKVDVPADFAIVDKKPTTKILEAYAEGKLL